MTLRAASVAIAGAMILSASPQAMAQSGPYVSAEGRPASPWDLEQRGDVPKSRDYSPLRRAEAAGDVNDWVVIDEAMVAEGAAHGDPWDGATLLLQVGADGRVSHCRVDETSLPMTAERLCPQVIERGRLIPALDRSGARTSDFFDLTVRILPEDFPPPPRIMVRPARYSPLDNFSPTVVTGGFEAMVAHPFSAGAYNGPRASVEVRPDDHGALKCVSQAYHGTEQAFADRACEVALNGRFDFTGANQDKTAHLLFFEEQGRMAVLLPVASDQQDGHAQADTMAEVRSGLTPDAVERIRFDFWVDVNGRIEDCTIKVSSGDDSQDFAACDRLERLGRFDRTLDPFGRAMGRRIQDGSLQNG